MTYQGYDGNLIGAGDRVELHPACDLWMRGARFGTVVGTSITKDDQFRVELDAIPGKTWGTSGDLLRRV